jgi:DnaJ-class molecular chaperone
MTRSYYDVLEVPRDATSKQIRSAYLRLSLQYHPDKNPPEKQDEAKSRFVEIGQAYETLKDDFLRQEYDDELRYSSQQSRSRHSTHSQNEYRYQRRSSPSPPRDADDAEYENYADVFDEFMASMSEAELFAAMNAASVVAGVVGGMIGSRLLGGGKSSAGTRGSGSNSTLLHSVGRMAGSYLASEGAKSVVKSVHSQSVAKLEYKRECQIALSRGEPAPPRPPSLETSAWQRKLQQIILHYTMDTGVSHSGSRTAYDYYMP